jgi:hypothetical protein
VKEAACFGRAPSESLDNLFEGAPTRDFADGRGFPVFEKRRPPWTLERRSRDGLDVLDALR